MPGKQTLAERRSARQDARRVQRARKSRTRRGWVLALVALVLVLGGAGGLYWVYRSSNDQHAATSTGSGYAHVMGQPGTGVTAPGFTLPASTGGDISLSDYRGKTVLLYFQEGLTCQACWQQLQNLEQHRPALRAAGVDAVVSITTDPVNLLAQKSRDMGLSIPVLSDPNLRVSKVYNANKYGMMGNSRDGHSFVLVDPNGTIRWRADYGGPPNYTMYLPTKKILADMRAEERSP